MSGLNTSEKIESTSLIVIKQHLKVQSMNLLNPFELFANYIILRLTYPTSRG